jgi:cardiolipin synthase
MQRTSFPFIKTYHAGNHVKWLSSGEPFFKELFHIINNAKEILHIQFYIFEDDNTGKEVIKLLINAAKRGVEVFIVVDAFGSNGLSKKAEQEMIKAGILFRRFAPILENKFIFVGRRLHHKIVVADNHIALVGGINIANKYHGINEPAWVDFAIKIEGELCNNLARICFRIWNKQFSAKIRFKRNLLPKINKIIKGKTLVRIRENDWLRGKKQITRSHRQAFKTANKSIIIVGSYFIPGILFRNILKKAVKRGVRIEILLTDISDVPMVKNATRYLYRFLLRNKIEFYEIEGRILHGKAVIVDGVWTTIGSYNINDLSIYNNVECNIDILDEEFAKDFSNHILQLMKYHSKEITKENYEQSYKFYHQFYDWISYNIVRFSAKILLFFTHRIKSDEE